MFPSSIFARLEFLKEGKWLLFITLTIAAFLAFWKLSSMDIENWDEARQVVSAVEMNQRTVYIDYFYDDALDTWGSKPPLLLWSITASFKLFGQSLLSARLPSAIFSILFIYFSFSIVRLYKSSVYAFVTCLVLMSCRAVFENHIFRTADFDAPLVLFLTAFTYYFLLYHDFGKKLAIIIAAVCLGLAFYSKGTAAVILLPGVLIFSLLKGTFMNHLGNKVVWLGFFVFVVLVSSWFALSEFYGTSFNEADSYFGSSSRVKTLLLNDTWDRYIGNGNFQEPRGDKYVYFFVILDILMNVWNYVFYFGVVWGIYSLIKQKDSIIARIRDADNGLLVLSGSMTLGVALFVGFSAVKLGWYYAPAFLSVAIIVTETLRLLVVKNNLLMYPIGLLLIGLLVRHFGFINSQSEQTSTWLKTNSHVISEAEMVYVERELGPALYAHLKLINYNSHLSDGVYENSNQSTLLFTKAEGESNEQSISCSDKFCFSRL